MGLCAPPAFSRDRSLSPKKEKTSLMKADYKPKNRVASIKQNWQKTLKEKKLIKLGEKTSSEKTDY